MTRLTDEQQAAKALVTEQQQDIGAALDINDGETEDLMGVGLTDPLAALLMSDAEVDALADSESTPRMVAGCALQRLRLRAALGVDRGAAACLVEAGVTSAAMIAAMTESDLVQLAAYPDETHARAAALIADQGLIAKAAP